MGDSLASTGLRTPATGSAPAMASRPLPRATVILLGTLFSPSTSLAKPLPRPDQYRYEAGATGSVPFWAVRAVPETEATASVSVSSAMGEVRRLSGLTWDQLARLFGVSRRSVHFWASGKPVNAENEERVRRILGLLKATDRGSAEQNRALLLTSQADVTPFDLLAAGRMEEALVALGSGSPARPAPVGRLSEDARAKREPLPVDVLAGAPNESAHAPSTRSRAVRTVRNRSDGRD